MAQLFFEAYVSNYTESEQKILTWNFCTGEKNISILFRILKHQLIFYSMWSVVKKQKTLFSLIFLLPHGIPSYPIVATFLFLQSFNLPLKNEQFKCRKRQMANVHFLHFLTCIFPSLKTLKTFWGGFFRDTCKKTQLQQKCWFSSAGKRTAAFVWGLNSHLAKYKSGSLWSNGLRKFLSCFHTRAVFTRVLNFLEATCKHFQVEKFLCAFLTAVFRVLPGFTLTLDFFEGKNTFEGELHWRHTKTPKTVSLVKHTKILFLPGRELVLIFLFTPDVYSGISCAL